MESQYHSRTLRNKISACNQALNRVRTTNIIPGNNQDHESSNGSAEEKSKVPIISLPGIDRIQNLSYSKSSKRLWGLILLICAVGCCYQIIGCVTEYLAGEAAIAVNYEDLDAIPAPVILMCPADLTGRNSLTDNLRLKYKKLFNTSSEDITFSDFLRIPNITMDSLWDLNGLSSGNIKVEVKCSPVKGDNSCVKTLIKPLKTSSGTCISVAFAEKVVTGESPINLQIVVPPPPKNWIALNFYFRYLYASIDGNPIYHQIQDGTPFQNIFNLRITIEMEKLVNLNLYRKPCVSSSAAESCIDRCIEQQLYSLLPCRLPYLSNDSMPLCEEPELFNKSMVIAARILNKRMDCVKSCPRKCEEYIFVPSADLIPKTSHVIYFDFVLDIRRLRVVREYYWYEPSSLFSDIGGYLGIFLGICFLNFFEGIDLVTHKIKSHNGQTMKTAQTVFRNSPENQQAFQNEELPKEKNGIQVQNTRGRKENDTESIFLISITGVDRILNGSVGIRRRLLWIFNLTLVSAFCIFQITKSISDYVNALPDTQIDFQKNSSVKFPTFTFCPADPFHYAESILKYKEIYRSEFNRTNSSDSDIHLSELLNLPDLNASHLWKAVKPEQFLTPIIKYQNILGMNTNDDYPPLNQTYRETVFGTCLSVSTPFMVLYEGLATNAVVYGPTVDQADHPNKLKLFIHDDSDDVNFLDPSIGFPLVKGGNIVMLGVTKIERLHHPRRPCAKKSDVIQCHIECFNNLLIQAKVNCSLPFMKGFQKPVCSTPGDFNRSLEISKLVHKEFITGTKCNCPIPLEEYIFQNTIGFLPPNKYFPMIFLTLLFMFKSNSWIIIQDYYKIDLNGLFAKLCGTFGLYLGICIPSFVEIIEYCILIIKNRSKTAVRPFST